jgi:hypothetical protein
MPTPKKIEAVRKTMQEQLDAQKAAVNLWRAEDPVTRERILPQPWELNLFLMGRLNKTRHALRASIACLMARDAPRELTDRLSSVL